MFGEVGVEIVVATTAVVSTSDTSMLSLTQPQLVFSGLQQVYLYFFGL